MLELAKQLRNVSSQACKIMGYSRDSFYRFKDPGPAACRLLASDTLYKHCRCDDRDLAKWIERQ